jgi:hypothetical protein
MPKVKINLDYYIENFSDYSVKIPWNIFVKILTKHYGCKMKNKSGSARLFICGEIRVTAHEPHGREKYVSKKDRERAIKYLVNVINEGAD